MKELSIDAEIKKAYQQGDDTAKRYPDFTLPEGLDNVRKNYALRQEVLEIRTLLNPILDGEITKGRNIDRYATRPELRKTTLKDARRLCPHAWVRLNALAGFYGEEME